MIRILYTIFIMCFLFANVSRAELPDHQTKSNSTAIKLGYHLYPDNDFMDFWDIDKSDFGGVSFELSFGRKIATLCGVEFLFGYFKSEETYRNVIYSGDLSTLGISNTYFSPSLKAFIPAGDDFVFYVGVGPDIYYTKGTYRYIVTDFNFGEDDSFFSFGYHGVVGFDFYLISRTTRRDMLSNNYYKDIPVSLCLEYKYTSVTVEAVDEKVINEINRSYGTTVPSHDLDVGGHSILLGLRWHY